MSLNSLHSIFFKQSKDNKPGLWANIHAKRKRGESPAKPGSEDYPDAKNWKKVTGESEKKASPAWQRSEGKNPEGGLNEKGRASLKAEGKDIKRPQPEGGARKDSFCARMKGMKSKLTSSETANDPDSRINKSLRKWKCGSAPVLSISDFSKSAEPLKPRLKQTSDNKIEETDDESVKDLFNTGTAAGISDYIPSAYTMARAGKATAVNDALGKETSFDTRHPLSSIYLKGGLGALAGAGLGAGLGGIAGLLTRARPGKIVPAATLAGALLGGTALTVESAVRRRNEIQKAIKDYKDAINKQKELDFEAADPGYTRLGSLMLPFGAFHRGGTVDALEHMRGRSPSSSSLNKALSLVPYASTLSFPLAAYGAGDRNQRLRESITKGASFCEKLGSHAGLLVKKAFLGDIANRASAFYGNLSPEAKAALIGAGVGGAGNVLLGNKRKGFLNRLLTGGAVGAAAGGLGRMGYDYYNNYRKQPFNAPNAGMLQSPHSTNMYAPVQVDENFNPLPMHSMPPSYNPDAPRQ